MGIAVTVIHDATGYSLGVDHPEIEGALAFRSQAVAQAVMNFLVEFNPYALVPAPTRDPQPVPPDGRIYTTTDGGRTWVPEESQLPPHVVADADDAAPQMMDKAEAVSR